MSESTLKCESNEAIFKQNYPLELFIALKMAYCCCSGLRGNLDFPDFLQKKFSTPGSIWRWDKKGWTDYASTRHTKCAEFARENSINFIEFQIELSKIEQLLQLIKPDGSGIEVREWSEAVKNLTKITLKIKVLYGYLVKSLKFAALFRC